MPIFSPYPTLLPRLESPCIHLDAESKIQECLMASIHDKRGITYLADVVFGFTEKFVKFVKFIDVVHVQNLLIFEYVVKTVNC